MGHRPGEPLRLLVVNWQDRENPLAGGAEEHLHEVFGRLAGRGHEVTALVSGWRGCEPRVRIGDLEVLRAGGRYTFSLAAPLAFRRHLGRRAFDGVIEDLNKVPVFAPAWARTPVVLLVHHLFGDVAFQEAPLPVAAATWLLERTVPAAYRTCPVVAVSASTRDDLVARGMDGTRITVITNGVDLDVYRPDDEERYPEPTILYLGRLKRYKCVDLPIRAVALLRERGVACRLLIGGRGDDEPRLRRLVEQLGVGDRVSFLGFVPEAEKPTIFRRSWVHVLTSPKEGWGITNVEAGACGTATVASRAPGLRDTVRDGETGFLVPHGDVGALANRLEALLGRPELRDGMGRRALEFARGLAWDRIADAWEGYLRERLAGSPRRV